MNLRTVRPRGTFHSRATRDGAAQMRDGQTYLLMNEPESSGDDEVVEIMFEDGVWMLASRLDLDPLP